MSTLVRRLLWLVPLVMVIAGVLMLRREHEAERLTTDAHSRSVTASAAGHAFGLKHVQAKQPSASDVVAEPLPYPSSLAGTEIDGALHVDASGRFLPDPDALRFFEYFLSALGELDEAALRARIVAAMKERLPTSAQGPASAFLDAYLSYRREAGDLGEVGNDPQALHAAIDKLYALRREHFGAKVADRLFGDEEAMRTAALERRLIMADKGLSERERTERLRELEADLPESLRRAREQAALPSTVHEQVRALRAGGGSDAEVRALRTKALGAGATERLEQLDRERADFEARLAAFRTQRASILLLKQSDLAKQRMIAELFERTFPLHERARAAALTR